jgi:hypothetical protein
MDRRQFLTRAAAAFSLPCCAFAADRPRGCRLAADGSAPLERPYLAASGYESTFDGSCREYASALCDIFGVRPALRFYDDSDGLNAFADPVPRYPDGPDGTVILGIGLLGKFRTPGEIWLGRPIDVIVAHEFGHIVQFKRDARDTWELEPDADFLAGWAIARWHSKPPEFGKYGPRDMFEFNGGDQIANECAIMFSEGDVDFNSPSHHGEPQFRAAMVRAGYESEKMDLAHAYAVGEKWSGLRR